MKRGVFTHIILLLLMISAAYAFTSAAVLSPARLQNISGTIILNVSTDNPSLNVTFSFIDTAGNFIFNTTILNDTASDTVFENLTFATTALADGVYNLSVLAFNTTGQSVTNTSITEFTIDNTAPNVLAINNPASGANLINGTVILNATINDTTLLVDTVRFNISNGTGFIIILASVFSGDVFNATINVSTLADGSHTVLVMANDTVGNKNHTISITFTKDSTAPTISSFTCTNANVGQSVSCDCTATDAIDTSVTVTVTGDTETTSAGTKTATCTATDDAGNQATSTADYIMSAVIISGGGGAAGAGGAISSGITGSHSTHVWTSIFAGEDVTVDVGNGEIGVSKINFKLSKTEKGIVMKVERATKSDLPRNARELQKVYKYIEIKTGTFDQSSLESVSIEITVTKLWLENQGLTAENVNMFRLVGNEWQELPTKVLSSKGNSVTLEAVTPGFSFFAIAAKQVEEIIPTEVVEPTPAPEVTEPVIEEVVKEPEPATEVIEKKEKSNTTAWVVALLVLAAGGVYYFETNKKHKRKFH